MIPIFKMSEEDHDQKNVRSHNPPEDTLSEEEFDAEYYKLYDEVEKILARNGENDPFCQGDYNLEPHIANSRGLGVEITNPEIVTTELIFELSDSIRQIDLRWEIYLGSGNYDFGIFVSASDARVWKRDDSSLRWNP